jgi:hypothetical protein
MKKRPVLSLKKVTLRDLDDSAVKRAIGGDIPDTEQCFTQAPIGFACDTQTCPNTVDPLPCPTAVGQCQATNYAGCASYDWCPTVDQNDPACQ